MAEMGLAQEDKGLSTDASGLRKVHSVARNLLCVNNEKLL